MTYKKDILSILKNESNYYPQFSVIIPQKDRAKYLEYTLKTCMIQDYPNFQVIVSDDCSKDQSVEVVRDLASKDSRIKLFAHKSHIGMRNNFEFALNQVISGYVICLGGDDGLVPGCIWRMYEILTSSGRELLTWTPASFSYPRNENDSNILLIKRHIYKGVKFIKSVDFLNQVAKTFKYQVDECPMIYMKGVASISLINRVKLRSKDNLFYHCPTPDGFSGIVLAGEVEDYAFTYEPLSITGSTILSQGANYKRTDKKSREEAQQFFTDNERLTMHKDLASQSYSPLETLMTADYLLTASDLPGWPGKYNPISFENLLKSSFRLIEKDAYENEVLERELRILKEIAKQHKLLDLYNDLLMSTKRRVVRSENIYGFLITNSIRFDGSKIGIKNIFDASIVVNFVFNVYNRFSFKNIFLWVIRQFKVLMRETNYIVEKIPLVDNN